MSQALEVTWGRKTLVQKAITAASSDLHMLCR